MRVTKEEIVQQLITNLWDDCVRRVSYAKTYVDLVQEKGGRLVFDHLAFRTINTHTGEQPEGILGISHIFEILGFRHVGEYVFRKKKLKTLHLQHADNSLPGILISQLEVEELPEWAQQILKQAVKDTPYLISNQGIELLNRLKRDGSLTAESAQFLTDNLDHYFKRPWKIPGKEDVLKLNDVSQFAAWTLLHGNSINHFAVSVNGHDVDEWADLETTCEGLRAAGIPMKETIEGDKESDLKQSASLAVKEEVEVKTNNGIEKIPWTYAYLELTERKTLKIDGSGEKLFSGFVKNQVRHLFDMTVTHEN